MLPRKFECCVKRNTRRHKHTRCEIKVLKIVYSLCCSKDSFKSTVSVSVRTLKGRTAVIVFIYIMFIYITFSVSQFFVPMCSWHQIKNDIISSQAIKFHSFFVPHSFWRNHHLLGLKKILYMQFFLKLFFFCDFISSKKVSVAHQWHCCKACSNKITMWLEWVTIWQDWLEMQYMLACDYQGKRQDLQQLSPFGCPN